MARKKSNDITKTGPMSYRDLRTLNAFNQMTGNTLVPVTEDDISQYLYEHNTPDEIQGIAGATAGLNEMNDRLISTPIAQNSEGKDYWGNSFFDPDIVVGNVDINRLSDIRAENQPWYSKLVNGIGKAGVLAGTTALETAGLLYGIGQGVYNAATDEESGAGEAFLHGLWDNPITNALQNVNEFAEEYMPNYYTQDEQENPFGNIFTANFLGDKLLKNLGFMVGAFYGGIPASSLIGKAGTAYVKSARAAALAERAGAAKAGMTAAEQYKLMQAGLDKVRQAAKTTRATSQTIGSLGSAINEGAIEAINNSKDWAKQQTMVANDEYQQKLAAIEEAYGGTEMETAMKIQAAEKHELKLAEIERGRARMGNADLLLNVPVLMASNMYQLGKLYSRGFDSTRRQMGSFLNGHKLKGSLEKGTLATDRTWQKGLASAVLKSNTEGLEEYLQRAASDGAGEAVTESINRFMEAGTGEHAENDVQDYIAGFGKAIADNLGDPNAWEEYMIGAVSSLFGMPVFGSQTKNAYIGKNGVFGFAGGLKGNFDDYMAAKEHEEQVAQYLNQRVKDPKFKALYDNLKKQDDYDKWLQEELEKGDKSKYKDLELEKFYQDLNAAASSGHLEEFKAMVGYNQEYTDEELNDIVKETSRKITADEQKKQDEQRKDYLEKQIAGLESQEALISSEHTDLSNYRDELAEIDQRLQDDNYEDKYEGPFIDVNGQMNASDPDKMREVLERNRQNLLEGIDDYLKIRNDIDIETDGRLDDSQIALLTQMKGKILDYEKRSANMADDLVSSLGDVKVNQEAWQEKIKSDLAKAQEEFNEKKAHWEKVQDSRSNKEYKEQVEKEYVAAEKKLNKAKATNNSVANVLKLLDMLTEEKDTTAAERAAYAKGQGDNFLDRLSDRLNGRPKRAINSDEAQAILANPQNVMTLLSVVNSRTSDLNANDRQRLTQEIVDLSTLANQKMAYNKKVREFLGDPSKINEAYQQAQDQISQKEKDNKSDELALNIKNARNMSELDDIMKQAYQVNPEIAQAALQKAMQTADDSTKKFLDDYERGTRFFGDFGQQVQKLPDAVKAGVMETAVSAWEYALQDGVDVYDKFVQALNEAVADLAADPNPAAKQTADGLKQILKDLDAAKRSTATNKNPKKTATKKKSGDIEEGDKEEEAGGLGALAKLRKGKKEEKKEEESKVDTEESILTSIKKEIKDSKQKDGSYKVDDVSKLSKELKARMEKYNQENPDNQLLIDMQELLDNVADEDISNDSLDEKDLGNDGTDLGEDNDSSERAEIMHENLRVSFKSDHPTEFRFNVDYRIPYDPEDKVLKAVQDLLKKMKAYQFVDKNYLGYIMRSSDENPEVYFLRSTDDTINSDPANPITFLAIKWDARAEKAVRKYGFNGRKDVNLSEEVSPITINGEQYQIVGVMTINAEIDENVSNAFASLQGALNQELNPQIEQAKQTGDQFVVSSKTTQIDSINTGRLEKRNGENDPENKVSLYDFMTDQQGNPDRRTSTEWDSGMDFYFGTVVNGYLNATEDESIREQMEEPNDEWMRKNNGAIVVFVPKSDGRLYPIRCTRRTVREWLESNDLDGQHNGNQLLDAVMAGELKNQYLGNILGYLKTIFDSEATVGERTNAKVMLSKYFIFGKQSPVHFNGSEVTLTVTGKDYDLTRDTYEEFVHAFFDALDEENIMFTLPTQSIEDVNGRDVVTAGIFEVGLRGFYNFNANFTIYPIDGEGNSVVVESKPEDGQHFTGGNNDRATKVNFDFGDGMKTYVIEGDGTAYYNGEPVDAKTQNLISLAMQAEQGTLPQFKSEFWDISKRNSDPAVKKFTLDGITGFDNVYIIHAEEDWIYDGRKGNHDVRLYKLSSDEGTKLKKEYNQAILDFNMNPENMEALKKIKQADNVKPSEPQLSIVPETPVQPVGSASQRDTTIVRKQFSGKTLNDLDSKEGGLIEVLATNKKSPVVSKYVYPLLQAVEEAGGSIDQAKISEGLKAVLAAKKEEKKKLLDDLLNEIKGCNRR